MGTARRNKPRNRRNKSRAVQTQLDGIIFDSGAESRRYSELKILEAAGEILNLELQTPYEIKINGLLIGVYTPDFQYLDRDGITHCEDVKGIKMGDFSLRARVIYALYPKIQWWVYVSGFKLAMCKVGKDSRVLTYRKPSRKSR